MANEWFEFKQFRIEQDKAAFKVGTDGCLLAAWLDIEHAERALDIGTGTGVIAMMMAQRTTANVDALEIDLDSAEQAQQNVQSGPWAQRMRVIHTSVQDFEPDRARYDHVVCNPPYFKSSTLSGDDRKDQARHETALTLEALFHHAKRLASDSAKFSMVLPVERWKDALEASQGEGWVLRRSLRIRPTVQKEANRILATWSTTPNELEEKEAVLYDEKRVYTPYFQSLLSPFYLHMD